MQIFEMMTSIGNLNHMSRLKENRNGLRILFTPLNSLSDEVREAIMLLSMHKDVSAARFMGCDGSIPACSNVDIRIEENGRRCHVCEARARRHLKDLCGFDIVFPKDILSAEDRYESKRKAAEIAASKEPSEFMYGDFAVGRESVSAVGRYALIGAPAALDRLHNGDGNTIALLERLAEATMLFYLYLNRFFDDFQPNIIISSHLRGVSWGGIGPTAMQRKTPCFVFGGGLIRNTLLTNVNAPISNARYRKVVANNRLPLTSMESKWIDEYLESRRFLAREYHSYYAADEKSESKIRGKLRIPPGDIVVGLFTSTPHELTVEHIGGTFFDMPEWVNSSIASLADQKGVTLIIKIHPGEEYGLVLPRFRIADMLRTMETLGEIPTNIRVIYPEDEIAASSIFQFIDLAVGYVSTAILECACKGIPSIMVGKNYFCGKGFTYDPSTKEEYMDALKSIVTGDLSLFPTSKECARKMLFQIAWSLNTPFEALDFQGWTPRRLEVNNLTDLEAGGLPGVRNLARSIIAGVPAENVVPLAAKPWEIEAEMKRESLDTYISNGKVLMIKPEGNIAIIDNRANTEFSFSGNAFDLSNTVWKKLLREVDCIFLASRLVTVDAQLINDCRRELPPIDCIPHLVENASAAKLVVDGDAWMSHPDAGDYLDMLLPEWKGETCFAGSAVPRVEPAFVDRFYVFIARVSESTNINDPVVLEFMSRREKRKLVSILHVIK